jgi:hypothetical protein
MIAGTTATLAPDLGAIQQALRLLIPAGHVFEVRALEVQRPGDRRPHTEFGYFNDVLAAAREAAQVSPFAVGTYVTLHEIQPALLARACNRLVYAKQNSATKDSDVLRLRWLFIDADPKRPAGISASDAEHEAALERAHAIRGYLVGRLGWPDVVEADSGNGAHILASVDLPVEDADLLKRCLEALAARFDDDDVTVDTTTGNASRIGKIYGTPTHKGDDVPDRPHRLARILHRPRTLEPVPRELLVALAEQAPKPAPKEPQGAVGGGDRGFDIDAFIARHSLDVDGPDPWEGGRKWVFKTCPWDAAHTNRSAFILQHASGAISAGCHHNGCRDRDWHALRGQYEDLAPRPLRAGQDAAAAEALRRERDEARAERDRMAAQLAEAQRRLDALETAGTAETIKGLELRLSRAQSKHGRLLLVLEDSKLSPAEARHIARLIDITEAYPDRAVVGEPEPARPEQRVWRKGLATALGLAENTVSHLLQVAFKRGHIAHEAVTKPARDEEGRVVTNAQGKPVFKSQVFIGPGLAVPKPDYTPTRRTNNATHQAERSAEKQQRYEAATRQATSYAQKHGCTSCGRDLEPTAYYCPHCRTHYSAEKLASFLVLTQGGKADTSHLETVADSATQYISNNSTAITSHSEVVAESASCSASEVVSAAPSPPSIRPTRPCVCGYACWSRDKDGAWYCSNCGKVSEPEMVAGGDVRGPP